ncbi:MAG: small metal-binding protein SmbP [Nitrospirota bacterium]
MKPETRMVVAALGFVVLLSSGAAAEGQHVPQAVEHAQAAAAQGRQGYPDALVTQAREALTHAEAARTETKSPHLAQGIKKLNQAIEHGMAGHGEEATKAAEEAVTHLSQAAKPQAEASSSDGY